MIIALKLSIRVVSHLKLYKAFSCLNKTVILSLSRTVKNCILIKRKDIETHLLNKLSYNV